MYFITTKDSETGKKFQVIKQKLSESHDAQIAISDKYGFTEWRMCAPSTQGTICSCKGFANIPDPKVWKKSNYASDEYFPSKQTKAGMEILKDFETIPKVSSDDINQCIGFNEAPFKTIGFDMSNENYFCFSVKEEWNVKIPADCEEITTTKYRNMFKNEEQ